MVGSPQKRAIKNLYAAMTYDTFTHVELPYGLRGIRVLVMTGATHHSVWALGRVVSLWYSLSYNCPYVK